MATIPIDEDFFCDGPFAVLTSQSLGGSGLHPHALADTLGAGEAGAMRELVERGVCLPLFFDADCALDGGTLFVVGTLDAAHAEAWILRLRAWLRVPCGRLVLLAGGGVGEELARAVSGEPASRDSCIYQHIDVPPGDYRVDVLAYAASTTVLQAHPDLDPEEIEQRYAHLPEVEEAYVVHLTPLDGEAPVPALVDEVHWAGVFSPRGGD